VDDTPCPVTTVASASAVGVLAGATDERAGIRLDLLVPAAHDAVGHDRLGLALQHHRRQSRTRSVLVRRRVVSLTMTPPRARPTRALRGVHGVPPTVYALCTSPPSIPATTSPVFDADAE